MKATQTLTTMNIDGQKLRMLALKGGLHLASLYTSMLNLQKKALGLFLVLIAAPPQKTTSTLDQNVQGSAACRVTFC